MALIAKAEDQVVSVVAIGSRCQLGPMLPAQFQALKDERQEPWLQCQASISFLYTYPVASDPRLICN